MDGVGGIDGGRGWLGQDGARNVADAGEECPAANCQENRYRPINKGLGAAPHTFSVGLSQD